MSVTFKATMFGDGARGARMQMHQCIEHPRITKIAQKASHAAEWVVTFHVDGIANHFPTFLEALTAMEAGK